MEIPAEPFEEFKKISRWSREVIVTEKIDGTNGVVFISDDALTIHAGSRSRWITPTDDNFGFAKWVETNAAELLKLGPGRHYGEWWGPGIQRGYGLRNKKFSLFNVHRWGNAATRPLCCDVVPTLWRGNMDYLNVHDVMDVLQERGSIASPGFMRPEGIVIFCPAGGQMFKKTLEKDEQPKGKGSET